MRKGARNQQKRKKQRKIIEIKQSKQISPVKQVLQPETEQSKAPMIRTQKNGKMTIPPLAFGRSRQSEEQREGKSEGKQEEQNVRQKWTKEEIQNISGYADGLVSVQFMKRIIAKEKDDIRGFFGACPPIVEKVFQSCLKEVSERFQIIREERVQRMKQDTVVFVPPDKDNFQHHKGKTLDNWLKLHLQIHQQKQCPIFPSQSLPFPSISPASSSIPSIFPQIQAQIQSLLPCLPAQIQQNFQQKVTTITQTNNRNINYRVKELITQLEQIVQITDDMREIGWRARVGREKGEMGPGRMAMQRWGESAMFFGIEDYFI